MKRVCILVLALGVLMSIMVTSAYATPVTLQEFKTQLTEYTISIGMGTLLPEGMLIADALSALVNAAANEANFTQSVMQAFEDMRNMGKDAQVAAKEEKLSENTMDVGPREVIAMSGFLFYESLQTNPFTSITVPNELYMQFSLQDVQRVNTLLSPFNITFEPQQSAVPEPSTLLLLGSGLAGLGGIAWRRHRTSRDR